MDKIGILGCGWLGLPLAKILINDGHFVKGTSTSLEKVLKLSKLGVKSYHYLIDIKKVVTSPFFKSIDTLVITTPLFSRDNNSLGIDKGVGQLIKIIEDESIKNVIYLSSISVYGSKNGLIKESDECKPESKSGIQILTIENLLNKGKFKTTLIRLGGLIGSDRHPIYSLSGKEFTKGNELINLIHQVDALGIILKAIKNFDNNTLILNAVTPFHPSKKDYYLKIANQKKILPPIFIEEKKNKKIVSSSRVIEKFNYMFQVDKLLLNEEYH
ncbi:MAG: SDR family NAD(P)-dependent oxidoreductase [Flavobacteriaceae bacterium]|nr:SDR family NAD(P)-dependent oxidoreductase [Flavobacteriaceae bacterium]